MKFSLPGLLRLKPFDESDDIKLAGSLYMSKFILGVGVVISAFLALISAGFAISGSPYAFSLICLAAGISAIVAGFEWNVGLRARPLNQLFITAIILGGLAILGEMHA